METINETILTLLAAGYSKAEIKKMASQLEQLPAKVSDAELERVVSQLENLPDNVEDSGLKKASEQIRKAATLRENKETEMQKYFGVLERLKANTERLANSPELERRFLSTHKTDGKQVSCELYSFQLTLKGLEKDLKSYAKRNGLVLINSEEVTTQTEEKEKRPSVKKDFEFLFALLSEIKKDYNFCYFSDFWKFELSPYMNKKKRTFTSFVIDEETGEEKTPFELKYLEECLKEIAQKKNLL